MKPACYAGVNTPDQGWHRLADVRSEIRLSSRSACEFCFPNVETFEEVEQPAREIVVSVDRHAQSYHRSVETGRVEFGRRREEKSLGELVRDGDISMAGGDA